MGKKLLIFLFVIALLFVGYTKYIRMLTFEKSLVAQWTLIETEYRHKSDLIFDMSSYISSHSETEINLLEQVRQARNNAAQIKIDPKRISTEQIEQFRKAHKQLIDLQTKLQQLGRSSQQIGESQEFREYLAELDGIEIRIANERRRLNEQVAIYNKYINGFFNIAFAQVFGFHDWPVFMPILGE